MKAPQVGQAVTIKISRPPMIRAGEIGIITEIITGGYCGVLTLGGREVVFAASDLAAKE